MFHLLAALYAISAAAHFALIARYGAAGNGGALAFGFIYAAMAVAVFLGLPYALWIGLGFTLIGIVGLSLNFIPIAKTVTVGVVLWAIDAAVIGITLALLFA